MSCASCAGRSQGGQCHVKFCMHHVTTRALYHVASFLCNCVTHVKVDLVTSAHFAPIEKFFQEIFSCYI